MKVNGYEIEPYANLRGAVLRRANLYGADLRWADLSEADLYEANLHGADLREAKLSGADLRWADLSEADLSEADLEGADLYGANLYGADLREAKLSEAGLRWAVLREADLSEADLSGTDLRRADLSEADLYGADLTNVNIDYMTNGIHNIPQDCSLYGYKKVNGMIVYLIIEEQFKRSCGTTRKCRCSGALVIGIQGQSQSVSNFSYGRRTIYTVGEYVYPDDYDEDRWNACSNGIHFFLTKEEAEAG